MGLPFWMGVFGTVVSIAFLIHAVIELKKDTPGHARNAAMIHVAMGSMFLPASLLIMFLYS
jgi:3-polyprenyl-4-hydroxybenzoate decarboxylase